MSWTENTNEWGTQHRSDDDRWMINKTTNPKVWMLFHTATLALHAQGSVGYLKHCAAYQPLPGETA